MAGFTDDQSVWSLLRKLKSSLFVPPPPRGGFSNTRRTSTSVSSNEGRTIATSSSAVNASGQSDQIVFPPGDTTAAFMAEFRINALSGTTMSIGIKRDVTDDGRNNDFTQSPRVASDSFGYGVGDYIGLMMYIDFNAGGLVRFFKNGTYIGSGTFSSTGYHFFAASNSGGAGTFQVTVESRVDSMRYAAEYAAYITPLTLIDWPPAPVAPDGAPPVPPPPAAGFTKFNAFETPSGNLSNTDRTLTTDATSSATAKARGKGSIRMGEFGDATFALEFTVDALPAGAMQIGLAQDFYFGSVSDPSVYFKSTGDWKAQFSEQGTSTAWAVGNKIGMLVYGLNTTPHVAFFRNGTLVGEGNIDSFQVYPPIKYSAVMTTTGAAAMGLSVQGDIELMTHKAVYKAYRDMDYSAMTLDAIGWPETNVRDPLATALGLSVPSTPTSGVGFPARVNVTANGRLDAGITANVSSSNGGDTPGSNVGLNDSARQGNVYITPNSTGSRTITTTNTGGLTNPSFTLSAVNVTALTNNVGATVSGAAGSSTLYTFDMDIDSPSFFKVTLAGGTGNADIYLREDWVPTLSDYNDNSTNSGNTESIDYGGGPVKRYYVLVYGAAAFSGATLLAKWTA